uniref:Uncharacterized protein n=1 Tax=viral metagenome TaxID=1070528 RepID=A0A6M3ITG6_9ZZZZ
MKKNFTFKFDTDMMEKVRVQAKKENRSLTNFIETLLINHMVDLSENQDCRKRAD